MLRIESLTKTFEDVVAVDDLSFHLQEGKVCGFIGPNGAGKTTTMRIIATLEEPDHGEVFVDGLSIFENPYQVRHRIGFMPDHYGVYPALTCEDYLEFYARAYEIESAVRSTRIKQIMEFTGLDEISGKKVEALSKGMKQRLNLSRALISDPKVLIMDEPAAGLDPRARVELRFLIKTLAETGKTIFVSSHILTELSEVCDHMLIISEGRKITFGSFEEIQKSLQKTTEVSLKLVFPVETERMERFLLQVPGISDVRPGENGQIRFSFNREMEVLPELIREIMNEDFSVIEFKPEVMSMEDIFIQITDGNPDYNGD